MNKKKTIERGTTRDAALAVAQAAVDKKAEGLIVLDVRGLSSFTDYMVICHGTSDRHVAAIVRNMEGAMKRCGVRALGIEGRGEGQWVLLDYDDIVCHVFYAPMRTYYALERLWGDAPSLDLPGAMSIPEETRKVG